MEEGGSKEKLVCPSSFSVWIRTGRHGEAEGFLASPERASSTNCSPGRWSTPGLLLLFVPAFVMISFRFGKFSPSSFICCAPPKYQIESLSSVFVSSFQRPYYALALRWRPVWDDSQHQTDRDGTVLRLHHTGQARSEVRRAAAVLRGRFRGQSIGPPLRFGSDKREFLTPTCRYDCGDIWSQFEDAVGRQAPCNVTVEDYGRMFYTMAQTWAPPCGRVSSTG